MKVLWELTYSFQTILVNMNAEKPGAFIVSQLRLHQALKKCYCVFCLSHSWSMWYTEYPWMKTDRFVVKLLPHCNMDQHEQRALRKRLMTSTHTWIFGYLDSAATVRQVQSRARTSPTCAMQGAAGLPSSPTRALVLVMLLCPHQHYLHLPCRGSAPCPQLGPLQDHPSTEELQHRQYERTKRKRYLEEKGVQKGEEITALIYTTCTTWLSYKLEGVITLNVLTFVCLKSQL